jgi:hypothetical protein
MNLDRLVDGKALIMAYIQCVFIIKHKSRYAFYFLKVARITVFYLFKY